MKRHRHDFLQMIHVLDGELEIDWGTGWHRVGPETLHVLPPGFAHQLRTQKGHHQFGLNFSQKADERGLLASLLRTFTVPRLINLPFCREWALLRNQYQRDSLHGFRQIHILEDYTISVLEGMRPEKEPSAIRQILGFLKGKLDRAISVSEAAQTLHLSRASLQRMCRRHFESGFAHLHERLRIENAGNILMRDDTPIKIVAARCGFVDLYHFSRTFKRVNGLSPLVFRKRTRSREV
ncbi:MAG: AraC family transcriptional regulator [Verrucomicrobiae bacterium]|nr:AraC family transcriptional regulator [Verrucomicrobiae bacterium]